MNIDSSSPIPRIAARLPLDELCSEKPALLAALEERIARFDRLQAILDHPEGLWVGRVEPQRNFDQLRTEHGKLELLIPELEQDAFMKKCLDSQREWVEKVAFYELMNAPDYALAYNHYFPGRLKL